MLVYPTLSTLPLVAVYLWSADTVLPSTVCVCVCACARALGAVVVIVYNAPDQTDLSWQTQPNAAITIPSFLINATQGAELASWYNSSGTTTSLQLR
jgi:hypothetical protein